MKLVKISGYACGYHSESEWSENYYVKLETYEKYKDEFEKLEIYIGGLDGKHSECEADIEIEILEESDLNEITDVTINSGYIIPESLSREVMHALEKDDDAVINYINSIDRLEEVVLHVPKSKVEELREFAMGL